MTEPTLTLGDCLSEIGKMPDNSISGVCTDPPYGLVEFSPEEIAKLRKGRGGIWRIPPKMNGCERKPLPRFTVLSPAQKLGIQEFFRVWAEALFPKLRPGAHVLIAGNPVLQMNVQNGLCEAGYENRATILRIYHGFRGGDRPKNAEKQFPEVCVTPRGNYEPWMLFRKPISERTVGQNLSKWGTGGLRMLEGGKPLPDVIQSFKTPAREKAIANHPSLKPQHLLRILVRTLLPLGEGLLVDPFMGSGSTLAACKAVGYETAGVEVDETYYNLAQVAVPQLAALYPSYKGDSLHSTEFKDSPEALTEQLHLLEDSPAFG